MQGGGGDCIIHWEARVQCKVRSVVEGRALQGFLGGKIPVTGGKFLP